MIDASITDIATHIRGKTGGHGADIVYNTVGSPYFTAACQAMAQGARQVFISTIERSVAFDILAFYRGRHKLIGIDTLALVRWRANLTPSERHMEPVGSCHQ